MCDFSRKILLWYEKHGRFDLPWKQNITPYRTWISEIMLQQTQASRVIEFYKNFMNQFPDINTLQSSNLDQVLKLWSGLGYYARAKNIHKTSKILCKKYNCIFPQSIEDIVKLPGIGRSTAGAIMSFSMNIRKSILDANVKRIITRYYGISGNIYKKNTDLLLWKIADRNTPDKQVADYNQAIMDLGSKVCKNRSPACGLCPLSKECVAYIESRQKELPNREKRKKNKSTKKVGVLLVVRCDGSILLERKEYTRTLSGLWRLPEFNIDKDIEYWYKRANSVSVGKTLKLKPIKHSFSHINFEIYPSLIEVSRKQKIFRDGSVKIAWYKESDDNLKGGMSTYTRKVIKHWRENGKNDIL